MPFSLIAIFLAVASTLQVAHGKPQMMGDPNAQAMMMDMAAANAAAPDAGAMMGMGMPGAGMGGDMMMMGGQMPGQEMSAMGQPGMAQPGMAPAGLGAVSCPGCQGAKCHTVCDYQRPVLRPEEIDVAIPQPPRYENVMVSPPKIHYCPGQVALQEVHQPPIMTKCVRNKLECVPMRAEFESQPVDPSVLHQQHPEQFSGNAAAAQAPCGYPPAAGGAYYGSPVKTSAL